MNEYYSLLGISPNSSISEIKAAYRKKVKQFHPDVYKGDPQYATEMMSRINEAYKVLLKNCTNTGTNADQYGYRATSETMSKESETSSQGQDEAFTNYERSSEQKHQQRESEHSTKQSTDQSTEKDHIGRPWLISYWMCAFILFLAYIFHNIWLFVIACIIALIRLIFFAYCKNSISGFWAILIMIVVVWCNGMKLPVEMNELEVNTISEKVNIQPAQSISVDQVVEKLYEDYFPVYINVNYSKGTLTDSAKGVKIFIDGVEIGKIQKSGKVCYGMILSAGTHTFSAGENTFSRKNAEIFVNRNSIIENASVFLRYDIQQKNNRVELVSYNVLGGLREDISVQEYEEKYWEMYEQMLDEMVPVGQYSTIMDSYMKGRVVE